MIRAAVGSPGAKYLQPPGCGPPGIEQRNKGRPQTFEAAAGKGANFNQNLVFCYFITLQINILNKGF